MLIVILIFVAACASAAFVPLLSFPLDVGPIVDDADADADADDTLVVACPTAWSNDYKAARKAGAIYRVAV